VRFPNRPLARRDWPDRQRLSLRFESGDDALGNHAQLDHLERDVSADRFFLLGHVDHATPALRKFLEQLETADAAAGACVCRTSQGGGVRWGGSFAGDQLFHEFPETQASIQQGFDAPAQCAFASAGSVQVGTPLGWRAQL
jgi:hypothetical protein